MNKFLFSAFVAFLSIVTTQLKAQQSLSEDSLKGFVERDVIDRCILTGVPGILLSHELAIAKKEFIYKKYYFRNSTSPVFKTSSTTVVQPSCTNMDFETGDFFGWEESHGTITDCVTLAGCCPLVGATSSTVINTGGSDPIVPSLPLASPFAGSKVARINNSAIGAVVDRIEQSFNVTSSNAIFQIASAAVLNSASGVNHCCTDQPGLVINLKDSAGNVLGCPYLAFNAPSACCPLAAGDTTWHTYSAGYYRGWKTQTIDLSTYIGSYVTIQITVMDCAATGHYGYAYIDCQCLPLEINLNGTVFDATPQTPIDVSTCGAVSAAVTAPTGLGPYNWTGPPGSGITGVTTQSISTTTPGTYTLTMDPQGGCIPGGVTKYIILHSTPNPTITGITAQATCTNATGSGTINVASGTSPFTYNWLPAASTGSVATGLSPGTDYTVMVVDTFGCQGSTTISIASFTDAPTYTINPLSANLTCLNPTLTVTANTSTNTTAVWTHTNTANFDVTTAGSYSCVVTNTISSCTATVPITITSNTIAPIAIYSLTCNGATVSLNSSAASGIALGWLAPTMPNPTPIGSQGTSTAVGVYTLTATNLTTGCKSTYTVASLVPNINVATTPANNIITCTNPTVQAVTTSTPNTNVIVTWNNGVTTSTVNSLAITSGGSYTTNVQVIGGCSSQSVITITTNTTVGVNITSPSTIVSCATNSLALTANQTTGGSYSYTWSPSSPLVTSNVYNVSAAYIYTVLALNTTNGCTATAVQAVTHETVTAFFIADTYQGLMPLPVTFSNTSSPNATDFIWNLGNGMTYTTTNAATIYDVQGEYPVTLIAINGFCSDTAMRKIKVDLVSFFTVPNVFTPNGDGKNDVYSFNAINMGEITFTVFDRWGLKIFDTTTTGNVKWDGKNKHGATVADGTYFYIIKAIGLDGVPYNKQGTINVFQ